MESEFKPPIPKTKTSVPNVARPVLLTVASTSSPQHRSEPSMRSSMTRSDLLPGSTTASPSKKKHHHTTSTGSSVYSPRWIINVKKETDRQVKRFLEKLSVKEERDQLSASVLEALEKHGNAFLNLRMDLLGESTTTIIRTLQALPTVTAKDKSMVIMLMLAISSCSRLNQYIQSVREAEKAVGTLESSRHGYDGQMEYNRVESPRLRDSANKRANFMSQSLDEGAFVTVLQLLPSETDDEHEPDYNTPNMLRKSSDAVKRNERKGSTSSGERKLCRVCEELVEKAIYEDHVKFCKTIVGYDIEVITADQHISKMLSALPADSDLVRVLEKALAVTAAKGGVGGFYECMGLKKEVDNLVKADKMNATEDQVLKAKELINRKMKALQSSEKTVLQAPRLPSPKLSSQQTSTPTLERKSTAKIPSIRDFEILKPITRGGYGGVYLARKKATHDLYAIKALNRNEMKRRGEMKGVLAERNILASLHSEWVVKMYFAMASKRYLFFVMEYMPGGDLFSLLRRFSRFEEVVAKFYVAEVLLALEDVHKQGIVHRDLKPDNILIGANGHVKLADFGLSAVGLINKQARDGESTGEETVQSGKVVTEGVKGTPHYLAPEILLGLPHGPAVDMWALGVMLFELCNGYPPFDGDSVQDVFSEIFSGNICWPPVENDEMSKHCKNLIMRLLDNNPDTRLSTAVRVKQHPFFEGVDFLGLASEEPPLVPAQTMVNEEDTSAFEEREEFYAFDADPTLGTDEDASSSSEEEEQPQRPGPAERTSYTNFWHVNVHNLAGLK